MATTPRITQGLGKLTPPLWARTMEAVEAFERSGEPSRAGKTLSHTFLARITGATAANAEADPSTPFYDANKYIWRYDFLQIMPRWSAAAATFPKLDKVDYPDGTSGTAGSVTENTGAFNLIEMMNTDENAGPGVALSDTVYPDPIESGTTVVMYAIRDPGGTDGNANYFYLFTQDNPFACVEAATAPLASRVMDLDLGTFVSATLAGSAMDFGAFT